MKKLLLFATLALSLPASSLAQFRVGFEGNGQRYIDDKKITLDEDGDGQPDTKGRFRSNAYLKLDYTLRQWDFGLQAESYSPMALRNFLPGLDGVGIGTLHARYRNSRLGLDVTGGHIYEQFGSGLILRTWEDRQLGINNSILGGRVAWSPLDGVALTALGGKQRVGMGFDLSTGTILAANLDVSLSELLSLEHAGLDAGLSWVGRFEKPSTDDEQTISMNAPDRVELYSSRLHFAKSGFYTGAEYVYKGKDVVVATMGTPNPNLFSGQALLVNAGYSERGLGLDVNLRRLENMRFYSQRDLTGNIYNAGIVNYLPALTRQYDFALQNIYIYQAQSFLQFLPFKCGEIGGQADLMYEFKRGSAFGGKYGAHLAVNASWWSALDAAPRAETYRADFFGFGERLYNDLGVEIRKRCSKNFSLLAMYLNQFYNKGYLEGGRREVAANTLVGEMTRRFGRTQSVTLNLQHQWAGETFDESQGGVIRQVTVNENWAGGGVEYAPDHRWAFFVNDMYNYGLEDSARRMHYYNAGVSFTTNATRATVSYGRQRGGLLCAGGVCRMVPEGAGVTINLSTAF